jgi:flagellar assembly protein FliH
MTAPSKFMFDLDFAAPKVVNTVPLADHQAQLGEAETRGYRNGFIAGEREATAAATAETSRRLSHALDSIGKTMSGITGALTGIESRLEAEAVEVAAAVARKLAHELIAREPLTEIETLVRECFRQLTATPHVVIRVNDELYPHIVEKVDALASESGFQGRLVVLAEPDIRDGDCRIEWADGGVIRDTSKIEAAIAENVGRFVAARRGIQDPSVKGTDHE